MIRKYFLLAVICVLFSIPGYSQSFTRRMNQQKAAISAAYKKGRITQREYGKLMDEQQGIAVMIKKYSADGYLSSAEKSRIAARQQRATQRLKRYRANRER